MYEFVLANLYTKISEKKICIRLGFQPSALEIVALCPSTTPFLCQWPFFLYRIIRKKNTIRKMRYVQIHPCDIVIPFLTSKSSNF